MGAMKSKSKKSSKGSLAKKVGGAALSAVLGSGKKSGGGGKRRGRGPQYWANKVIVAKLKKKYRRITYGGA